MKSLFQKNGILPTNRYNRLQHHANPSNLQIHNTVDLLVEGYLYPSKLSGILLQHYPFVFHCNLHVRKSLKNQKRKFVALPQKDKLSIYSNLMIQTIIIVNMFPVLKTHIFFILSIGKKLRNSDRP